MNYKDRKPPRLTRTARVTRTARNGCIFTRNGCPAHPFRVAAQRPGAALRPFLILLRPERARSGAFSGRSSVRSGRSGRPPAGTAYRLRPERSGPGHCSGPERHSIPAGSLAGCPKPKRLRWLLQSSVVAPSQQLDFAVSIASSAAPSRPICCCLLVLLAPRPPCMGLELGATTASSPPAACCASSATAAECMQLRAYSGEYRSLADRSGTGSAGRGPAEGCSPRPEHA